MSQREAADCGVAALAMIARYHRISVDFDALRAAIPIGARGASLQSLQQAAATLGLRSQPVRIVADQLQRIVVPAIAHLIGDHYIVLFHINSDGIVVGDPATGVYLLDPRKFRETWSGTLLLVTRSAQGLSRNS